MPTIETLKADIAATKKRAQAQEAQAAESWKKAQELEKELAKLENVLKFQKELFEEKL